MAKSRTTTHHTPSELIFSTNAVGCAYGNPWTTYFQSRRFQCVRPPSFGENRLRILSQGLRCVLSDFLKHEIQSRGVYGNTSTLSFQSRGCRYVFWEKIGSE